MRIPFTKAHGAGNDFLLTWANDAPYEGLKSIARAICDRHTGIGADGWILVQPAYGQSPEIDAKIRLFNADGSEPELSGNGTRCAAAFLIDTGIRKENLSILTGAGVKQLRLLECNDLWYEFEMNMGSPKIREDQVRFPLSLASGLLDVTLVNAGNPQCAVFVDDFGLDWRKIGAEIESHPQFPNRTNVSFIRVAGQHTLEVRFFERGVGETASSGTGATGAVAAAVTRRLVESPVRVLTPAGPLNLRWEGDMFLVGPAQIIAGGEYYFRR